MCSTYPLAPFRIKIASQETGCLSFSIAERTRCASQSVPPFTVHSIVRVHLAGQLLCYSPSGIFWSSLWPLHRHNFDITFRSLAVHFSSDRASFPLPFFLVKQSTAILTTTFRLAFDHYPQLHERQLLRLNDFLQCLPLIVCTRVVQARTKPTFGKEMSRAMRRSMEELSTR
jgi:hypothetical protein